QTLTFRNTQFDIVTRKNQPWLQAAQISKALGYARDDAASKIYSRNADEFTRDMTLTPRLGVNGINASQRGKEVRLFSLRGAHLLAMFARTELAKEFRRWVLDVLDREVEAGGQPAQPAAHGRRGRPIKELPNGLTADQQLALRQLIRCTAAAMPARHRDIGEQLINTQLKIVFNCNLKEIPQKNFEEACRIVAGQIHEGEYIPRPAEPQRTRPTFADVLGRPLSAGERYLVGGGHQESYMPIPSNAAILTPAQYAYWIRTEANTALTTAEALDLLEAVAARLRNATGQRLPPAMPVPRPF